jgi:streptogramin lyase
MAGGAVPADTALALPQGIAVDRAGNVFIAETRASRVRRIDADDGTITTIAGNGTQARGVDGVATASPLIAPRGLAVDTLGNVYFCDSSDHRVRKIDRAGTITTIFNLASRAASDGDGGPAVAAAGQAPTFLAVHDGEIFFVDIADNTIRFIDAAGIVHGFAGFPHDDNNGTPLPTSPEGTPAPSFVFNGLSGIAVNDTDVFVAERGGNRVWRINKTSRLVQVHAGTGVNAPPTANQDPRLASVSSPIDVALAPDGALFVLSSGRNALQRVSSSSSTAADPTSPTTSSRGRNFGGRRRWRCRRRAMCSSRTRRTAACGASI